VTRMPGAQFENIFDGKPQSYCDREAVATDAAEHLKRKHPHSGGRGERPREREDDDRHLQAGGGAGGPAGSREEDRGEERRRLTDAPVPQPQNAHDAHT